MCASGTARGTYLDGKHDLNLLVFGFRAGGEKVERLLVRLDDCGEMVSMWSPGQTGPLTVLRGVQYAPAVPMHPDDAEVFSQFMLVAGRIGQHGREGANDVLVLDRPRASAELKGLVRVVQRLGVEPAL